jgi:hypothetical protein
MITTILGEDPEERLPQLMIPHPTFTVDIPSIGKSDEINLSESLEITKLKEPVQNTTTMIQWQGPHFFKLGGHIDHNTFKDHPLYPQFAKSKKGFDLLLKHGYLPFKGLGKNEDGRLEPISPVHHLVNAGLGFTGRRSNKGTLFVKGTN